MTLIQREATRMGRLVEDLLMLAQFDQDRPLDRQPVDLSSIAAPGRAGRPPASSPAAPITLDADAPVIVDGDARAAAPGARQPHRQRPAAHPAGISGHRHRAGSGWAGELIVADHGPGMTADQASRVFERFYRTDRARSRARGGNGLGLSIAAALVAAHDGTITVGTAAGPRRRLPGQAAAGRRGQRDDQRQLARAAWTSPPHTTLQAAGPPRAKAGAQG